MKALRRPTHADVRESNLLTQMGLQARMAHESGQISTEVYDGILIVCRRCHTHLMMRTGIVDRKRQAHFNKRAKKLSSVKEMDIALTGLLLGLVIAWIYLL